MDLDRYCNGIFTNVIGLQYNIVPCTSSKLLNLKDGKYGFEHDELLKNCK